MAKVEYESHKEGSESTSMNSILRYKGIILCYDNTKVECAKGNESSH
jgi:hypothetical protein